MPVVSYTITIPHLCQLSIHCSCSGDVPTITADDFEKNLRETLEEVRKHIPILFVNLVLLGNLSEVCRSLYSLTLIQRRWACEYTLCRSTSCP